MVPIVVHEAPSVQHSKRQVHGHRPSGCDVPINVAIGVAQRSPFCLLESELDQELKEFLSRIETTREVGAMALLDGQEDHEAGKQWPQGTTTSTEHDKNTKLGLPDTTNRKWIDFQHL